MKSAIATEIAIATAIATGPHAHEGSLAPIAPIVARTGDISSFLPLDFLRLHDFAFLILTKSSLPSLALLVRFDFLFDYFSEYVMCTAYFSSAHLNVFLGINKRLAVYMFKKLCCCSRYVFLFWWRQLSICLLAFLSKSYFRVWSR